MVTSGHTMLCPLVAIKGTFSLVITFISMQKVFGGRGGVGKNEDLILEVF